MPADQQVIQRWTGAAPYWEKHGDVIRQMFQPVTHALSEDAQVSARGRVLDIASGAGEPALSLARIAPGVMGIDAIPRMAAGARRAAEAQTVRNAFFAAALADHLPFQDNVFEAAVCRFGVMFFPSPVEGVREILRVLKGGRRVSFAVWSSAESNPFFSVPSRVLSQYTETPPAPSPDVLDAFRFAVPGKLKAILEEGGAAAVSERIFRFQIGAPITAEEFWAIRYEMSDTLQERVTKIPDKQWPEVQRHLFESLGKYATPEGMSMPSEVLIVSGEKADR